MKFKVGDKVLISKDSEYYGGGTDNPDDTYGYIRGKSDDSDLNIIVIWDTNENNLYNDRDLIPVIDKCKIIIGDQLTIVSDKKGVIATSYEINGVFLNGPNIYKCNKDVKLLPKEWVDKLIELYERNLKTIYVEYNSDHTIKRMIVNPKDK